MFFFCGMHESIAPYLQGLEFFLIFFFLFFFFRGIVGGAFGFSGCVGEDWALVVCTDGVFLTFNCISFDDGTWCAWAGLEGG